MDEKDLTENTPLLLAFQTILSSSPLVLPNSFSFRIKLCILSISQSWKFLEKQGFQVTMPPSTSRTSFTYASLEATKVNKEGKESFKCISSHQASCQNLVLVPGYFLPSFVHLWRIAYVSCIYQLFDEWKCLFSDFLFFLFFIFFLKSSSSRVMEISLKWLSIERLS